MPINYNELIEKIKALPMGSTPEPIAEAMKEILLFNAQMMLGLETIRDLPLSREDNLISAHMRNIAKLALEHGNG
jgi:hypothetical protein